MQQRIKHEQLNLLFAGLPSMLLATLLLVALTLIGAEITNTSGVLAATAGIVIVSAVRYGLVLAYRRYSWRDDLPWSDLFFVGCIAAGSAWGIAALMVYPQGDIAAQSFISFIIAGVSAASVTTLAVDRRNVIGFVIPCVVPVALRLLAEPGHYGPTMGVMGLLYVVMILAAGFRLHRQIHENIVLRLEASERQQAQEHSERALETANRQMRDILDAANHVAIIALNETGVIKMINRGAERMLGYTEAELADKLTLELLLDAEEVQNIAQALSTWQHRLFGLNALLQHTRESGSYSHQCTLVGKQGHRVDADLVVSATRDAKGAITGFLATAIDIGERKRAAEALTRLNERFKLATHSSGMGIWDWDVAADTLVWDERTYEIYGAPRDLRPDMKYMLRTVHPDDVERARTELVSALTGKQQQLLTSFRIICPSGEERVVSASGLTLRNAAGRTIRMTGLIWDATEIRRVERMKNEFVATVSHELRTPLTSIRGSLGLIAGGVAGKLPERAASLVTMALNNCERLTLLINDILDMEKLESDKQRFDVQRWNVAELIARSLEDNAGFADSLGVRFTTPEPLCDFNVTVDHGRFLQVMANLLSNASKFSPAGAAIEVSARKVNGPDQSARVRVEVRDFGRGIPPEFQSRIFQKFSQADSSDSRSRAGTGLGLAISRAIVERLGGQIGFNTGPGGTTFYFELPEATLAATLAPVTPSKVS